MDSIGRRVVQKLHEKVVPANLTIKGVYREMDLGSRVVLDPWGGLLDGMQEFTKDGVHPAAVSLSPFFRLIATRS